MKTYAEKRFFEWHEDDVSVTLRNKGGSYGGGSETLIIYSIKTLSAPYVRQTTSGCNRNKSTKESW